MYLLIPGTAGTLFAAMPIWSASSTGVMRGEWPVRITGMQAALVIGTVQRRRRVFQAMQLPVRRDTGPESRQDMQPQDTQLQVIQLRERCISPASLPDSLGTVHARALPARRVGRAPPRQPHHQLLLQQPRSVMRADGEIRAF